MTRKTTTFLDWMLHIKSIYYCEAIVADLSNKITNINTKDYEKKPRR